VVALSVHLSSIAANLTCCSHSSLRATAGSARFVPVGAGFFRAGEPSPFDRCPGSVPGDVCGRRPCLEPCAPPNRSPISLAAGPSSPSTALLRFIR
jgi:hypothetical protein